MQKETGGESPTTGYYVWRVLLKWRAAVDRALAPVGLTHAQYVLLSTLHGLSQAGRRPSQRELADVSGLEPMFISKLARVLEQRGLLERERDLLDPRALQLYFTPRGREVITIAIPIVREIEEQQLAPLGGRASPRSLQLRETLQALLDDWKDLEMPATRE